MIDAQIITGILIDDTHQVSFIEVCEICAISEDYLIELVEHGIFGEPKISCQQMKFNQNMISRVQSAERLQRELDVNLQGVVLAIELLEELDEMKRQLDVLKRSASI